MASPAFRRGGGRCGRGTRCGGDTRRLHAPARARYGSRVGNQITKQPTAKSVCGGRGGMRYHTYGSTLLRCDVVIKQRRAMAAVEAQMDRMKEAGGETQSLITMQRSRGANRRRSGSHGGPSLSSFIPAAVAAAAAALRYSNDTSFLSSVTSSFQPPPIHPPHLFSLKATGC